MRFQSVLTSVIALLTASCDMTSTPAAEAKNQASIVHPVERERLVGPTPVPATAVSTNLPADVIAFRSKRDECDHFRGEDATDEARAAELEKLLDRTCKGTDAALAALRKRYAKDPAVIAALADYDGEVE